MRCGPRLVTQPLGPVGSLAYGSLSLNTGPVAAGVSDVYKSSLQCLVLPDVGPIQAALSGLPTPFEAPPQVHAVSCPRFKPDSLAERPRLRHPSLYIAAVRGELEWIGRAMQLLQLFGATSRALRATE